MLFSDILLTYEYEEDGRLLKTYEWFDSPEELKEFVEESKQTLRSFKVLDSIKINDCEEVELDGEE
jgi:predicted CopG family antitoxin